MEIRAERRCLLCHCALGACREITSRLNGWRRLVSDGFLRGGRLASCLVEFSVAALPRRGMSNDVTAFVNGAVRSQSRDALAVIIYCLFVVTHNRPA